MASVTTNDLRITNAKNFVSYLTSGDPSYMFIGRPTSWDFDIDTNEPRLTAGDNSPPYPQNNWRDFYRTWDQMLGMKKIGLTDVQHMIPRLEWTSGVTYDMYRHDYTEVNRSHSNGKNLYDCLFYVVSQTNNVYVCLDNNNNEPSTVEPLSESNQPFYTSDGYQWLKLFTVSSLDLVNKATNNFMPIVLDNVNSVTGGGVYTVVINSRGDGYTVNPRGSVTQIPYYYCNILGDGTGAVAKVTVGNGKILEVKVVRPGEGYTRATLDFTANRVYESLADLDGKENGLNPLGDGSFDTTVIISPPGGWGTDIIRELGATRVGVFSDFSSAQSDYVIKSEFRQIGIMSGVTGHLVDGIAPETMSCVYAVSVNEVTGSMNKDYDLYETITQTKVDDEDPTIKYVAKGTVVGWDDDKGVIRYIQDPKLHSDDKGQMYRFSGDEPIVSVLSGKETIPTRDTGEFEGMTFVDGYANPEVDKYSGVMEYLTNLSPIRRSPEQSERVSLIISY